MKKILLLLLLLSNLTITGQSQTRKVLFIGNSYTEVNNLPQIIANAASSVGDALIFDSHTPGGYKLIQHSTNALTQNKIMAGGWDYVVMQGQSQEPIIDEYNFQTGALALNNLISQYNPCAVPIFYMTWGRKNGDPLNCPNIPVMCTYEGMDTALKTNYLSAASNIQTEISPVSVVWRYLRQNHPAIELYQSDESHPSAAGSYAAACSFYASIFRKDPTLITFNYDLNPTVAAIIRNAAKVNVFDNLSQWDYAGMPVANFSYTIGNGTNEVVFSSTMQYADNYLWDFGDGTTSSTTLNPTHSYADNGTYTVTLTASNCDFEGVHNSTHTATISFCSHTPTITPETLQLCPGGSETLWTQPADSYQWYENGVAIPGATNQYYVAESNWTYFPSVMTTINGCSELSKTSFVGRHSWQFQFLVFSVTVEGNIFDGNKVCLDETVNLNVMINEPHLTQWYKDDEPIPFANNDTFVVTESGTYKAKVSHPMCSNMFGFSDDMMGYPFNYEFIECSLGNDEFTKDLVVSPNPVHNILNIKTQEKITEILVCDILGNIVIAKGMRVDSINVSGLSQGMYIIKVLTENGIFSTKFIKE